jgi:predicted GNAT family acetyltransferase
VTPDDDIATTHAVAMVSFAHPGTDIGEVADEELTEVAAGGKPSQLAAMRERMVKGLTVTALADVNGRAVAAGSHNPIGGATEIVGVGTLPALRRRGLGAAVTSVLVEDALSRGISHVLLSAGDDAVARVYARLGFRVVGTAGAAEPPGP